MTESELMSIRNDMKKMQEKILEMNATVKSMASIAERQENLIEKIAEVSSNLSQLLAVQGNRIENQEKITDQLSNSLSQTQKTTAENIEAVKTKIESKEVEAIERIHAVEAGLEARMRTFEKWMWTFVGVGIAAGLILQNSSIVSFLTQ